MDNLQNPTSFRPVHSLSREEIKQERDHIDSEIRQIESSLLILKQRRNALAPVYRLSADVMICIFEHLQNPYQRDPHDGFPHDPPMYPFAFQTPLHAAPANPEVQMEWVRAMTHVCSQWRTLSLDTPTLWTRLRLRSYDLAQEMSRRTQSAPISVICDIDNLRCDDRKSLFSDILQTRSNRIKHLEIAFPDGPDHITFVSEALQCLSENPIIEAFYCKPQTAGRRRFQGDQGLYMPMKFLQYSASTLRYLTLEHCCFSIEGINLPLALPSLSRLTIMNNANRCGDLLQHIKVPSTCSVHILAYAANQTSYQVLHEPLQLFWQHRRTPIKSMSIILPPKAKPRTAVRLCLGDDEAKDETFVLVLAVLAPPGHVMTQAINGLCSSLPIQHVSRIRIGVDLDQAVWSNLSSWCPTVKSLEVRSKDCNLCGFLHMLGSTNSDSDVSTVDDGNIAIVEPFLSLETLTLGEYFDFDIFQGTELLRRWIQRRISLGVPLKRLNLFASSSPAHAIPDGSIQSLRQFVKVQFDLVSEQAN